MLCNLRVGVTTFGADGGASGIGSYLQSLLEEFPRTDPSMRFELFGSRSDRLVYDRPGMSGHWLDDRMSTPLINLAWHQAVLPGVCRRRKLDVLFLPAANRRLPVTLPCPTVGTVHDFSSLHVGGKYDWKRDLYIKRILPALVRRLSYVITVSECSKRDIIEYAHVPEDRVIVIPNGVDQDRFRLRDAREARNRVRLAVGAIAPTAPYILYVARLEHPGKNHVRLIRAFARMKQETGLPHQLVLAGKDWNRSEEIHRAARQTEVAAEIVVTGYVPPALLPDLYTGADLCVFPSLYEGFGLPILEAMASGVPVACSNVSSLPEVAGEAAHYFDPHDEEDMARTMRLILTDGSRHLRLRQMGLAQSERFSWRSSAMKTIDVLRRAAKEGRA